MAGQLLGSYSLRAVTCIVGGIRLEGYGADGGISIEANADIAEPTVGADGETVVSSINDENAIATITLMETSRAYTLLLQQLLAQQAEADLGPITPRGFKLFDPNTGEGFDCAYYRFLDYPAAAKGSRVGERAFRIFLRKVVRTAPTLNLVG